MAFLWIEQGATDGAPKYSSPTVRSLKATLREPDGKQRDATVRVFAASPNVALG